MAITGTVTITGVATQGQTLTASNDITDSDGITSIISYLWKADNVAIGTASASNTLVLGPLQAGKKISVTASYFTTVATAALGTAVQVESLQTDYVDTLPTGGVTIAGTATQGQVLKASNNIADADGIKSLITYQWKQNGESIDQATDSTLALTQALVGKAITVTASYTDILDRVNSVTSTATSLVANVNDTPTGAVTIDGEPIQGRVLTTNNNIADSDGLGAITYQWKAGGTNIAGATTSTLTLAQAQVGKVITVTASYTDSFKFAESISSIATTTVANVNDLPTGSVTIAGTPTQGKVLTASNTITDLDGLGLISYQWKADSNDIVGATAKTLTLGQAEVGKVITVAASYIDLLGTAESLISVATKIVSNTNDAPVGTVTITGLPTQDQMLSVSNDLVDVDGIGEITYQWKANNVNISGAKSDTFTLTQAQVGKAITVTANYFDAFGQPESVTSAATSNIRNKNDFPTGELAVTGTPMIGQVLSATHTLADPDGLGSLSYQWQANGIDIFGATSDALILTQTQVGKVITVTARYTDLFGTAEEVISAETSKVTNNNTAPTGSVTISGTPSQFSTLTANNMLNDVDGLGNISYQWKENGNNILNAISATLTLSQEQVGKVITVVASYTDKLGSDESATSVATVVVSNVNDSPTGTLSISGNSTEGHTLSATNNLMDADGMGAISYQWSANGLPIPNATSDTLDLGREMVGKLITVNASYMDGWGTRENITSNPSPIITAAPSAPTIRGIPSAVQLLTMGEAVSLNNLAVSDPDMSATKLELVLYAQNGAFSILTNPGSLMPALKLTGTAAEINTSLQILNFAADAEGSSSFQAQLVNPAVNLPTVVSVQFNSPGIPVPGINRPGQSTITGDGNGDGIVDTTQTDVSSIIVSKSSRPGSEIGAAISFITLVADSDAGKLAHPLQPRPVIQGLIQTDIISPAPTNLEAPMGSFAFTTLITATESKPSFSLYVDSDLGINGYWVKSPSGYWLNLALPVNGGGNTLESGKLRLDFQIEDGGVFDSDGLANGMIVNSGIAGSLPLSLVGQPPANPSFGF